jgi:hypothetical protein
LVTLPSIIPHISTRGGVQIGSEPDSIGFVRISEQKYSFQLDRIDKVVS